MLAVHPREVIGVRALVDRGFRMPTTTQLVISSQSRPGVMAQVASVLGEAGVNIKAFSAPEVTGTGKLRLLVADLEGARTALRMAKIKFAEETALILSLENKPGAERSRRPADEGAHQYQVRLLHSFTGRQTRDRRPDRFKYRKGSYYSSGSIARRVLVEVLMSHCIR